MWALQPQKSICRRLLLCCCLSHLPWLKYSTWHRDAGRQEVQHTESIWNDWLQLYRGFTYHWTQTNYVHLFFILTDPFSIEPFKSWCQAHHSRQSLLKGTQVYFIMLLWMRMEWGWNWKYLQCCTLHFVLSQARVAILFFFFLPFVFPTQRNVKKFTEHLFSYLHFIHLKSKQKNICWPRHINYTII